VASPKLASGVYIDRKGVKRRTSLSAIFALELCARLTKEFAGDRSRRKDCLRPIAAKVRGVLDERLGVPVPLEDDALGLIVVDVDLVLQRSGVLGPHDLHAFERTSA
jgi:hypothetical protein